MKNRSIANEQQADLTDVDKRGERTVGEAVSEVTLETFHRSDEENKCQEAALRLLDAAARPSEALRERLIKKEFSYEIVDVVVQRLICVGLVNDEAYARQAVRYCISRDMGESGTFRELTRKGVDADIARRVVDEAKEEGSFYDSAYALVEKIAKKTRGLDRQVRLRRLWSAAGRKGHSPDLIRQAQSDIFN
ncbi:regulatory protein RecX [Alloscardovia venturai]|uniref:Regulatory protein RecX n=1 Tax=Alloscardovia venturai TaxID=1769421 RepID=A0ABW2Y3Q8_9BIFI